MIQTEVISEIQKYAKTKMTCNACEWLKTAMSTEFFNKLTPDEQKSVTKAAKNKYMIMPGQQYWEYVTKYGKKEFTTAVLIKIHDICIKYKVYHYLKNDDELVNINPKLN